MSKNLSSISIVYPITFANNRNQDTIILYLQTFVMLESSVPQ